MQITRMIPKDQHTATGLIVHATRVDEYVTQLEVNAPHAERWILKFSNEEVAILLNAALGMTRTPVQPELPHA